MLWIDRCRLRRIGDAPGRSQDSRRRPAPAWAARQSGFCVDRRLASCSTPAPRNRCKCGNLQPLGSFRTTMTMDILNIVAELWVDTWRTSLGCSLLINLCARLHLPSCRHYQNAKTGAADKDDAKVVECNRCNRLQSCSCLLHFYGHMLFIGRNTQHKVDWVSPLLHNPWIWRDLCARLRFVTSEHLAVGVDDPKLHTQKFAHYHAVNSIWAPAPHANHL